jgi:hypothetical protein
VEGGVLAFGGAVFGATVVRPPLWLGGSI